MPQRERVCDERVENPLRPIGGVVDDDTMVGGAGVEWIDGDRVIELSIVARRVRQHEDWRTGQGRVDELVAGNNEDGEVEMGFGQNWQE